MWEPAKATEFLDLSPSTLRDYSDRGIIACYRIGKHRKYSLEKIREKLEKEQQESGPGRFEMMVSNVFQISDTAVLGPASTSQGCRYGSNEGRPADGCSRFVFCLRRPAALRESALQHVPVSYRAPTSRPMRSPTLFLQ